MIEIAVEILSALAKHWPDFFIILTLLIANVFLIGFWKKQASDAIQALKQNVASSAKVLETINGVLYLQKLGFPEMYCR